MSSTRDWLANTEQDLVVLCNKWKSVISSETNITNYGWHQDECIKLDELIFAFLNAHTTYKNVNSSANRQRKDSEKKKVIAAMRRFANAFVRYNSQMDDVTRAIMGIHKRNTNPSVRPRPVTRPETMIENTKNRFEHKIKALSNEAKKMSKPADAYGIRFAWQIGGEKPMSGEDLPKSKFSRRSSITITYTEANKGKPAYYATCYENARGEAGPWSLLVEAYIG